MTETTLAAIKNRAAAPAMPAEVAAGFDTVGGFELLQRSAKLFANSDLVPSNYRNNIPNCAIACDMALRLGANPLLTMQNLYIITGGRPSWSAQFLIATLNKCGRFSALRYSFQGQEGKDDWGCRAVATELATGEKLEGPLITIALAKKEGWYGKNGSKWQTMPEMMLRYRAAAWFVRVYAPEIAMGLQTADEVRDTIDLESGEDGQFSVTTAEIKAEVVKEAPAAEPEPAPKPAPKKRTPKAPVEQEAPAPAQAEEPFANDPAPAAEPQPEHGVADAEEPTVICPNTGREKPIWACNSCMSREGCPMWPDKNEEDIFG